MENIFPGQYQYGSVGWSIIPRSKGCGFDARLGRIPRLWVPSPVQSYTGGSLLMFLGVSLCLLLSVKAMKNVLGERKN